MTSRQQVRSLYLCLYFGLNCLQVACAGPNMHFDPKPAPPWIADRAMPNRPDQALHAVGEAPATVNVQRDVEMATRDAKVRLGQLFESRVVARSSDWSITKGVGSEAQEHSVVSGSVDVRTAVTLEDTRAEASYRDEVTQTQYVLLSVNVRAWVQRLERRLTTGFAALEESIRTARSAIDAGQVFAATRELAQASRRGMQLEPDAMVLELLDATQAPRQRLSAAQQQMAAQAKELRERFPFAVEVSCSDSGIKRRIAADLESFLKGDGFRVADVAGKGAVRVVVGVQQSPQRTERVAGRSEFIHAGQGTLKVLQPNGSEVGELAIIIDPKASEERDVNADAAAAKALALAADTIVARFRSAYRELHRDANSPR